MNKLFLIIIGLVLLSACPGNNTANNTVKNEANNSAPANSPVNTTANSGEKVADLKAFSDKSMSIDDRIKTIEEYVKSIEAKLPKDGTDGTAENLKRKETDISKDAIKDATDEKWAKMHSYSDGDKLKRLKVYSAEGEKKTEEFYFYDDKPIFAFIEDDGMGKKGDASEAKGDKFYFGSEGLIAFVKADGTKVDASSEEFKKYNEKLIKEAATFEKLGK